MTLTDCKHEGYDASQPYVTSQKCKLCNRYAKVKNFVDFVPVKGFVRCPDCHKLIASDSTIIPFHYSGINTCDGTGLEGQKDEIPNFER